MILSYLFLLCIVLIGVVTKILKKTHAFVITRMFSPGRLNAIIVSVFGIIGLYLILFDCSLTCFFKAYCAA